MISTPIRLCRAEYALNSLAIGSPPHLGEQSLREVGHPEMSGGVWKGFAYEHWAFVRLSLVRLCLRLPRDPLF